MIIFFEDSDRIWENENPLLFKGDLGGSNLSYNQGFLAEVDTNGRAQ
ncbi:hypothetical protein PL9631_540041 [Planktothrix paucivesiculata PCC 9631]|uniref:Uncharacterized protein n=1 Tax=Planktothrix paucivesiculata PCC 9631 TaxID=671071 RepID=A0A7Z9BTV8_9CYAN|nr:hypothetical protein PL9631_540041 [Planktothrix paucivesiculata PCC 9631]